MTWSRFAVTRTVRISIDKSKAHHYTVSATRHFIKFSAPPTDTFQYYPQLLAVRYTSQPVL